MVINRVERLSASEYVERPVARLEPDWQSGLVGTHTVNWSRGLFTVDGVIRRSKLDLGAHDLLRADLSAWR